MDDTARDAGELDRDQALLRIAQLETESRELSAKREVLGDRLYKGDRTARPELNAAIARDREISEEIRRLRPLAGLPEPDYIQVMYGPPWRMSE